jgi:SRSO17 transposase
MPAVVARDGARPTTRSRRRTTYPHSPRRTITWRAGTTGPLRSRFAAPAIWPAHGVSSSGPLPTTRVQLLLEWPKSSEAPIKYWLASLGDEALGLRRFVRLAKGRWRIEQDYRELTDELGLDHFEGRAWPGWHHHITLASMAYAFLVFETLRGKQTAGLTLPAVRRALQTMLIRLGTRCPTCHRTWNDLS